MLGIPTFYSRFYLTQLDSVAEHFYLIVKPSQINERFVRCRPTDAITRL
jgi:hypothetical protein